MLFIGGEDGAPAAHLAGDRASGKIYALSMGTYDDDGDPIRRIRRAQHISDEMKQTAFHELELDVGERVGPALFHMRWSDNGGDTFNDALDSIIPFDSDINPTWTRLGAGRDRVFEVYSDAAVKHAWLDAYLLGNPGSALAVPFPDPPPMGAEFAVPVYGPDGTTIRAIEISPVWQQWFGTFQEGFGTLQAGVDVMGLSLAQLQSELATLTQDNVDSIGAAIFGEDYKGSWTARTHNVGNVRSYAGKYYKCIVGRTSANTVNPGSDTTGWELIGSAADLGSLSDDNLNAIGGASFGGNFQGTWEAGIFAAGHVVYHDGFFYECTVARTAANTDDPSVDAGSWSITSTTDDPGDVSQAVQAAIDGSARIEYGARYKEEWSAGAYAVGDVVYHDGVFYECDAARTASNTDDPETDTTGWSPKASSEGGITQAVQNAIDAQAAINFGEDYKGVWAVGAYAVGDVVYFHGDFHGACFYECTQTRTANNTSDPSVNASCLGCQDDHVRDHGRCERRSNQRRQRHPECDRRSGDG